MRHLRGIASLMLLLVVGGTAVACESGCGDDRGTAEGGLATAERWVRLVSIETSGEEEAIDTPVSVVPVGPGMTEGAPSDALIDIHPDLLEPAQADLEDGHDVFLSFASQGLEREMVASVISRDLDGRFHIRGPCGARDERFLRDRLGARFDAAIASIIGITRRQAILDALGSRD